MSEQGTGGVRYVEVDEAYFEKRGLRRYAGVWSLVGAGRRRGHLRPVLGLEPRPRARRLGRHADRHAS